MDSELDDTGAPRPDAACRPALERTANAEGLAAFLMIFGWPVLGWIVHAFGLPTEVSNGIGLTYFASTLLFAISGARHGRGSGRAAAWLTSGSSRCFCS